MKTKYTSQTAAAKPSWKKVILLAVTALALCATPAFVLATDCTPQTTWTDSAGSWFTCSNWSNNECPDSGIAALINNGGTAQVNSSLQVGHANNLTLGYGTADSGNVSVTGVTGGSLSISGSVFVAYQGTGTMTVSNGGSVGGAVATSGNLSIASLSGQVWTSNGSASVDGSGSTWTVSNEVDVGGTTSGAGGTGLLSVTNGGTVSAGTAVHVWNSGTLTGNGTVSINSGSGTVTVDGTLAPSGTLTISGNVTFGSIASNMRCNVSSTSVDNAQVSGRALLNGKLSVTVSVTGDFTLLHAGNGFNGTKFSSYSFTYIGCLSASVEYRNNNNGSSDVILHVVSTCN